VSIPRRSPVGFCRGDDDRNHQTVDPLSDFDGVDRNPDTVLIDVEAPARDAGARSHAAQRRPKLSRVWWALPARSSHIQVRRAQGLRRGPLRSRAALAANEDDVDVVMP
jgi:hypothetical protein